MIKGVVLIDISLRMLHLKKQNPLQRPIVSAIQTGYFMLILLYRTLLFYSTLFYSTLFYSTLFYTTLFYSVLIYFTLFFSPSFSSTILYSTLLLSALILPANLLHTRYIFSYLTITKSEYYFMLSIQLHLDR